MQETQKTTKNEWISNDEDAQKFEFNFTMSILKFFQKQKETVENEDEDTHTSGNENKIILNEKN